MEREQRLQAIRERHTRLGEKGFQLTANNNARQVVDLDTAVFTDIPFLLAEIERLEAVLKAIRDDETPATDNDTDEQIYWARLFARDALAQPMPSSFMGALPNLLESDE